MWRKLSTDQPSPAARSSHCLSVIGSQVLLFSGEGQPRVPADNKLFSLDLAVGQWSEVDAKGSAPPPARVGHASAAVGSKMFVFGGRTSIEMGEGLIDQLHCFDVTTNEWSEIEAGGEKPCGRSFHAMTSDGSYVYLFGGCVKDRLNDLYRFDPVQLEWKRLPTCDKIRGRGGAGLVHVEGSLYVIAGFIGEEVDDMFEFDIASESWTQLHHASNIPAISVFGSAVIGKRILLTCGEVKPSDLGHAGAGGFSNDVYVFDTKNPSQGWTKLQVEGEKPLPRGWFSAAATSDDNLILFGGLSSSNERLSDTWFFQP